MRFQRYLSPKTDVNLICHLVYQVDSGEYLDRGVCGTLWCQPRRARRGRQGTLKVLISKNGFSRDTERSNHQLSNHVTWFIGWTGVSIFPHGTLIYGPIPVSSVTNEK